MKLNHKIEASIFTSGKNFRFTKDPQIAYCFKQQSTKEKDDCGETQRWKSWKEEENKKFKKSWKKEKNERLT